MTQENLQQQLEICRRRLAIMEKQAATFGKLYVPPYLVIEIESTKLEISRLEELLHLPTSYTKRPPGALPPVWNVPHSRNPNFTGRGDLLAELEQTNTAAITQAIAGLGGVGKTQLATEYAYRHAADFALVWWVRAEEPLSLRADLAGLAAALGLEEAQAQEQQVAIDAALRWLQSKGTRWLLVFDNVNFPHEVKPYLPQGGDGKVIVTSRYNGDWRGVAIPLRVKVLEKSEAVQFLLNRSEKDEPQAAEELATELDCLPLALEHAAAYVAANRAIGLAGYLKHYREKKLALLAKGQLSQKYHDDTILTTWEIAFEKLEEAARDLFNLCAFLSPEEIPLSLFEVEEAKRERVDLPATMAGLDELGWIETLGKLAEYSLVEVKEQVFTLHRLVQAVGRERLGEEERKEWAGRAARLVSAALTSDVDTDIASWAVYARLQGHALAAAGETERLEVEPDATTRLLNQVAIYVEGRADYQTSLALKKRALALAEKAYGLESEKVATYANNLGGVLKALGDLQGAKALYERALSIVEKQFGENHPYVASSANNLGLVLQALGDFQGAKQYLERAFKIFEKELGENHPNVATLANNLGLVLKALGDYQGAKQYLERALSIDEKIYGNDHPTIAIRAGNLGKVLQDLGNLHGAKALHEHAFQIFEKVLGESHPYVATAGNDLGLVLQDLGDLQGAKHYLERALTIDEKVYGNEHPKVAIDANNLGMVLKDLGDYQGAKQYLERALSIDEKVYGNDHPKIATRANNLGSLLYAQGDYAGAKPYFVRALAICRKFLGEEHPNTKVVKGWLEGDEWN